ncbi:MAG: PEP-CTERM sorting domain-containing protein [Candidatus Omnitrophica bacterium]|nr:PEP-CTERM sorting domain-containing protein [Candidatus Omnitrophota bacterium]
MKKILGSILFCLFFLQGNANAVLVNSVKIQDYHRSKTYSWTEPGISTFGSPVTHNLSDGTSWDSDVSGYRDGSFATYNHSEINGTTIKYYFDLQPSGYGPSTTILNGEWSGPWSEDPNKIYSSKFALGMITPLYLEAEIGSTTAFTSGLAEILYVDPSYSNYENTPINAKIGDIVPYELTYNIDSPLFFDVWDEATFQRKNYTFTYNISGLVDFNPESNCVPEPASLALIGTGLCGIFMRRKVK